jgi:hypothetical protein
MNAAASRVDDGRFGRGLGISVGAWMRVSREAGNREDWGPRTRQVKRRCDVTRCDGCDMKENIPEQICSLAAPEGFLLFSAASNATLGGTAGLLGRELRRRIFR